MGDSSFLEGARSIHREDDYAFEFREITANRCWRMHVGHDHPVDDGQVGRPGISAGDGRLLRRAGDFEARQRFEAGGMADRPGGERFAAERRQVVGLDLRIRARLSLPRTPRDPTLAPKSPRRPACPRRGPAICPQRRALPLVSAPPFPRRRGLNLAAASAPPPARPSSTGQARPFRSSPWSRRAVRRTPALRRSVAAPAAARPRFRLVFPSSRAPQWAPASAQKSGPTGRPRGSGQRRIAPGRDAAPQGMRSAAVRSGARRGLL